MSLAETLLEACGDMRGSAMTVRLQIQYDTVENVMSILHEQAGVIGENVLTGRPLDPSDVLRFGAYMMAAMDRYALLIIPDALEMYRRADALIPGYVRTGVPISHPDVVDRLGLELVAGWAACTCAGLVTWKTVAPSLKEVFYGKAPLLLGLLMDAPAGDIENVMF